MQFTGWQLVGRVAAHLAMCSRDGLNEQPTVYEQHIYNKFQCVLIAYDRPQTLKSTALCHVNKNIGRRSFGNLIPALLHHQAAVVCATEKHRPISLTPCACRRTIMTDSVLMPPLAVVPNSGDGECMRSDAEESQVCEESPRVCVSRCEQGLIGTPASSLAADSSLDDGMSTSVN